MHIRSHVYEQVMSFTKAMLLKAKVYSKNGNKQAKFWSSLLMFLF